MGRNGRDGREERVKESDNWGGERKTGSEKKDTEERKWRDGRKKEKEGENRAGKIKSE